MLKGAELAWRSLKTGPNVPKGVWGLLFNNLSGKEPFKKVLNPAATKRFAYYLTQCLLSVIFFRCQNCQMTAAAFEHPQLR